MVMTYTSSSAAAETLDNDVSSQHISDCSSTIFSETCLGAGRFTKVYRRTCKGDEITLDVINNVNRNHHHSNNKTMPEKSNRLTIGFVMSVCSTVLFLIFLLLFVSTNQLYPFRIKPGTCAYYISLPFPPITLIFCLENLYCIYN